MRGLSEQDLLHVWESGAVQHPLDRALTMLSPAYPTASRSMLAQLSIGQRDTCLFALRELTFGSRLTGTATCPSCKERIEFSLNLRDMGFLEEAEALSQNLDQRIYTHTIDSYQLHVHTPTSLDIAMVAKQRNDDPIALLHRCITQVTQDGTRVDLTVLPEIVANRLVSFMAECDPHAEVELDLTCAVCQHRWSLLFDIVTFFWIEIAAQAKRLLRDVHMLACAYGWRETDILTMSATRRQLYLEMVAQ
jgi:hypothetical protein